MLVGCFLVSKVLVQKVYFKPYKMAKAFNINSEQYSSYASENYIMMGYLILAVYTEIVFDAYK